MKRLFIFILLALTACAGDRDFTSDPTLQQHLTAHDWCQLMSVESSIYMLKRYRFTPSVVQVDYLTFTDLAHPTQYGKTQIYRWHESYLPAGTGFVIGKWVDDVKQASALVTDDDHTSYQKVYGHDFSPSEALVFRGIPANQTSSGKTVYPCDEYGPNAFAVYDQIEATQAALHKSTNGM